MSCHGINAINPVCRIRQAATAATHDAFSNIAGWFAQAAGKATTWLWDELGSATSINLDSPHLGTDLAVTGAIAAVLSLGLFVLQVITATLRREPGALGRAVKGLLVALLASAFALTATKILLGVVDKLSDGIVRYAMNTNMPGLGRQLQLANLTSGGIANPAAMLLFSVVVLAAVVVVWAAMMIRKMMIIIAAVLTPLAFSGATADITRGWVRRWIEFLAAMIVSKLLLVIILMVGISVVEGAGQSGSGVGQSVTQLATGSLILLMGGFAPWVAIKMFHFTGDALAGAHAYAAQAPAGAAAMISAPQKMHALHTHASTVLSRGGGGGASQSGAAASDGGQVRDSSEAIYDKVAQRPENTTDTTTDGGTGAAAPTGRPGVGTGGGAGSPTATGGSADRAGGSPTVGAGTSTARGTASGAASGMAGGAATAAGGLAAAPVAVTGAARNAGASAGRATQNATLEVAAQESPTPRPVPTAPPVTPSAAPARSEPPASPQQAGEPDPPPSPPVRSS